MIKFVYHASKEDVTVYVGEKSVISDDKLVVLVGINVIIYYLKLILSIKRRRFMIMC